MKHASGSISAPTMRARRTTRQTRGRLREVLAQVRRDGCALNNEELELGSRSIAVPVRGASAAYWRR